MRRLNLSTVLVAFNLTVVAAAIAVVGLAGVSSLRQMGREQALSRLRQAGATAVQLIAERGERLVATAELLAAQPDAGLHARAGRADSLQALLRAFIAEHELEGALVLLDGHTLAAAGAAALPADVALWEGGARWFLDAAPGSPAVALTALAPLPGFSSPAQALVVRFLHDEAAAELGARVGASLELLTRRTAESRGSDPRVELRLRALEGAEAVAAPVRPLDRAVSVTPLRSAGGQVVGLIEVSEPLAAARPGSGRLIASLLVLVLAMGGLATVFGLLLARSIARPVEELTTAALRIGHGDFSTPVPRSSGTEVATLAGAMEEMRDQIQRLTTELRRRRAEAEAVLGGIAEGVFAVGRARRIRYLNAQAAAMLGIDPREAQGRFCGDVLNPQGPGGVRPCEESCPILHAPFRGGAQAVEHLRLADGRMRTVRITSSPPGPAGEDGVTVQIQVMRDETELEATRRLRDSVLANISHEFRTPLSAQLASLELLRDRLPELSPEDLRDLVLSIERGTLRLTRLVDNLLESTRIEAGRATLRRQSVALDEVIEEAVALTAPLIDQRRQSLQIELPYPLPEIVADGPRLVQVFVNLLANANKFAPPDSPIRIGGAVGEREVQLWVEDEGPGLPEGAGESIFQRFTRSPSEEPEESGMGLGLFIVKSIVERHGGRVEARGLPKGTRMLVALPRDETAAPRERERDGTAADPERA